MSRNDFDVLMHDGSQTVRASTRDIDNRRAEISRAFWLVFGVGFIISFPSSLVEKRSGTLIGFKIFCNFTDALLQWPCHGQKQSRKLTEYSELKSCRFFATAVEVLRFRDGAVPIWDEIVARPALSGRKHCKLHGDRAPWLQLSRQAQHRFGARAIVSIRQAQRPVVRFGDLPAQGQTNSGAVRFRGEKRNEKIRRVHDSRALRLRP